MKYLLLAFVAAGMAANAQTSSTSVSSQQTNESTLKIENVVDKDKQMKDTDQEITNNKLRAELGSKSKWSIRTSMNYQGGTVQKAFSAERPEIRAQGETDSIAYFSADLAVKYRTTDMTSLNFGTGLSVDRLFHRTLDEATNSNINKSQERGRSGRNANVSDPYLEGNVAYRALGLQNVSALTYYHLTDSFYTDTLGRLSTVSLTHSLIKDVGNNSLGLALAYMHHGYDNGSSFDERGARRMEAQYYVSPFYEYAFNDKYNFRTVFNWFSFDKRMGDSEWRQAVIQQSMGLGVSITRDIFLYPNVQFIPQDIRADRTNVALSAYINVF